MKRALTRLFILSSAILLLAEPASAGPISGNITSTLTITQDSWLTGNVTCNTPTIGTPPTSGNPCIVFGASNISLKLNGHTITGQGASLYNRGNPCPAVGTPPLALGVLFERAIDTDLQNNVTILGPGLIGEFRAEGILVSGNNSLVQDVVVSSTCREGIFVEGSNNDIEHNTVVRSSLTGTFLASIFVTGAGGHTIRHNRVAGSGPVLVPMNLTHGGQGIFIGGFSSPTGNNLIEGNFVGGIPGDGIFVASHLNGYKDTSGNSIIRNSAFGNVIFYDIYDSNTAGANTYQDNACEVSFGTGAPPCPNLPDLGDHHDDGGQGDGGHNSDGHDH